MHQPEKNSIKGFNILELLVVIVIVGIISAISFPTITSWTKDREVTNAAQRIKTLMKNIVSQSQRGKYGFVQFLIEDKEQTDGDGNATRLIIVKSSGMKMNSLMTKVRSDETWNAANGHTTWCDTEDSTRTEENKYWDDAGTLEGNVPEVGYYEFKNIATNIPIKKLGAVCFSTDGTWYSGAEELVSGNEGGEDEDADIVGGVETEVDSAIFICSRKESNLASTCFIGEADGIPDGDTIENHSPIFAISWSRFGNITMEKWGKNGWVLQ